MTLQKSRGLDLSSLTELSEAESAEFSTFYRKIFGHDHRGLQFWLDHRPQVLKGYRAFANAASPGSLATAREPFVGFFMLEYYALLGYATGVRYLTRNWQHLGCTKEDVLEGVALAFLHAGPRGMETIAEAYEGFDWVTPQDPITFPEGWAADPDALKAGLDYSSLDLTTPERKAIEDWYERWLGYVPLYVRIAARERPRLLKAYRYRYEHSIVKLPKQVIPVSQLHFNVVRCHAEGIRENVKLAKAWGVAKEQVVRAMSSPLINAGIETLDMLGPEIDEVLEKW